MEAEEEKIVGHAKEAIHALTDKKKSWKEKIGSFLWEILIIIIAVNLTIWFHSWSDKRHERELEKEFLIGTKGDLETIKNSLEHNYIRFEKSVNEYYNTIWKQINEQRIDKDYVDSNATRLLLSGNNFIYDNSRFESYKFSGNLRLVENAELLKDITHLYFLLENQVESDKAYYGGKGNSFLPVFAKNNKRVSHFSDILNTPEITSILSSYVDTSNENLYFKQRLLLEVEKVITEIDKELKDRFGYEPPKEEAKKSGE